MLFISFYPVADKQLKFTAGETLLAARMWQRRESVRRGESEGGGQRGRSQTAETKGDAANIGMLGRIQVTSRWEYDPKCGDNTDVSGGGCWVRRVLPPPRMT